MATALKNYQLYIGGEWVDGTTDDGLDVINPATEETIGAVPQGAVADIDRARTVDAGQVPPGLGVAGAPVHLDAGARAWVLQRRRP